MIQRSLFRPLQAATRPSSTLRLAQRANSAPFIASQRASQITAQRLSGRRWYAAEAEAKKEETLEQQAEAQGTGDKTTKAASDEAQKQLEAKNQEIIELKDKLVRQVAEYRNLQEQTKREVQAGRDYALQRFAKDLLEPVDTFDRALSAVEPAKLQGEEANKDLVNLHSGLRMLETSLMSTLKRHGVERFDPAETSEKFDPNKMEATFQAPQQGKDDGTVFYTQQKGFLLNGRVLRAAKVGVVKNS